MAGAAAAFMGLGPSRRTCWGPWDTNSLGAIGEQLCWSWLADFRCPILWETQPCLFRPLLSCMLCYLHTNSKQIWRLWREGWIWETICNKNYIMGEGVGRKERRVEKVLQLWGSVEKELIWDSCFLVKWVSIQSGLVPAKVALCKDSHGPSDSVTTGRKFQGLHHQYAILGFWT